jgi:hypothetical protein
MFCNYDNFFVVITKRSILLEFYKIDDRSAEEVRKALEVCDLEEAVAKFITNNSTGENR